MLIQNCSLDLCHQFALRDIIRNSHRKDTIIHIGKILSSAHSIHPYETSRKNFFQCPITGQTGFLLSKYSKLNMVLSRFSLCFGLSGTVSSRIWTGKWKPLYVFQVWRIIVWRVRGLHNCWKTCRLWRLSLLKISSWRSKVSGSQKLSRKFLLDSHGRSCFYRQWPLFSFAFQTHGGLLLVRFWPGQYGKEVLGNIFSTCRGAGGKAELIINNEAKTIITHFANFLQQDRI